MKKLFLIPLVLVLSLATLSTQPAKPEAPKKLTPAEAKEFVGKYVTVVGKVVQVRPQEKITHLNFEKPHPYQTFTAVVYASRANVFTNLDQLVARTVEVSGKVEEYNGKPQIVLQARHQLKVVDEAAAGKPGEKTDTGEKPKSGK